MRHVMGIVLAVGLGAALFFAAGWGYDHLLGIPVVNGGASTLPAGGGELLHDHTVLYAFGALAGTGLLAGLLVAVRRVSPLAPGLPGLALVAWTVVYGLGVRRAVHYIPLRGTAYGVGFEAMLMNGLLAAAGLALVVPLFIPSRWRPAASRAAGGATGAAPDQQPGASPLLGDNWSDTAPYPSSDPFKGGDPFNNY
jgi:hypothetical protein